MGLLQRAVETYDANLSRVGLLEEGKTPLAPVYHTLTSANIIITVDGNGRFIGAEAVGKKAEKVIFQVTDKSANRTIDPCPHPLCDQLKYIADYTRASDKEKKCFPDYVNQLKDWCESEFTHPKLAPILKYVQGRTILHDLADIGLLQLDGNGKPKEEKTFIIWRVVGIGEYSGDCWNDMDLFRQYERYCRKAIGDDENYAEGLDLISGETVKTGEQHPKGIVSFYGNAKLISSNDSQNFTYRGRFTDATQAATIGSVSSWKAHNALKWLTANQGVMIGGRTFVCWNPKGYSVPDPLGGFFDGFETEPISNPTEYKEQISRILNSRKAKIPEGEGVVIASFDAATNGRLSLTYFNELDRSDFLDRLSYWEKTCCWINRFGISSPSLQQIIKCAFGVERSSARNTGAFIEADDNIMKEHIQRLLTCRVDMVVMPFDIMKALFEKSKNPLSYERKNRDTLQFTACAIIRKYKTDKNKEEWSMALEPEKHDLSYQYGRLLAVMEKAERDTYDKDEGREPNAVRLWSVFCRRPQYAAKIIIEQLKKSYLPRLTPLWRRTCDILIGEICDKISEFPDSELNKPLKETYLLGYYLQKNALYKSNRKDGEEAVAAADKTENQ